MKHLVAIFQCFDVRRCSAILLAILLMPLLNLVHAAEDLQPPVFSFSPVEEGFKEQSQVFSVLVTDNGDIATVSIFYRFISEGPYANAQMQRLTGTDIFTHTLPSSEIDKDSDRIEYYIRATDVEGNLSLEGFSFDPIIRTLTSESLLSFNDNSAAENSAETQPLTGLSTSRKLLYGALGILAVGALISASGSSGGGSGAQADAEGVGVTVLVDPLSGS